MCQAHAQAPVTGWIRAVLVAAGADAIVAVDVDVDVEILMRAILTRDGCSTSKLVGIC